MVKSISEVKEISGIEQAQSICLTSTANLLLKKKLTQEKLSFFKPKFIFQSTVNKLRPFPRFPQLVN